MKQRGRGRPAKEPDDLITIDEAVAAIKEYLAKKYSPAIAERCAYSKGTLYNKCSKGELHAIRKGKYALLSRSEVIKLVS